MKKRIAVLAAVAVLLGSAGETVSAETGRAACPHTVKVEITAGTRTNTYTHPAWVANKPNGDPILVPCTAKETWQEYREICRDCGLVCKKWETCILTEHSVHH